MAEVLEFPEREVKAYAFLASELAAMMAAKGADDALIEFATTTLRDVYQEIANDSDYSFKVDLPAGISVDDAMRLQQQIAQGIDSLRSTHHDAVVKLVARLLLVEMRLFQEQRHED